jgi:carbonic anhydrase/acetyltransferase-like protein (isoleucine patch superfamily)
VPIYALDDLEPTIDPSAFIHPDAVIIGDVRIGPESSVWPCAVLRGDGGHIAVGARSSIQDGTVVHTTPEHPTVVGDECVIGHLVHLEGCIIEDRSLVGSGAVVLHRVIVRTGGQVAANAVVTGGLEVPSGALAVGLPARIKEGGARTDEIARGAAHYVENAKHHASALRRLA